MKITGRNGVLRILDGARQIADAAQANMKCTVFVSPSTWTDKTAQAYAADASYTGTFCAALADRLYIGFKRKFAMLKFVKGAGGAYAGAGGTAVWKYYNGSSFVAVSGLVDGTRVAANSIAQDGVVSLQIPSDWAKQGNANLDATMYFVELSLPSIPSPAPSMDVAAPVDGQYHEVAFAAMDFNGPIGRPRQEELIALNRGKMDAYGHYIKGADDKVYAPLDISFAADLDDTVNREWIMEALICGTPGSTLWASAGTTTKGFSKNDGTNYNPVFADALKKAVNVQILWDTLATGAIPQGYAFYETFFPPDAQSVKEGDGSVQLSCKGAVYGVIERIYGIGNRY